MSTYDKDKVATLMAQLIAELPGFTPLEVPKSSDAAKRMALASMYKEISFRDYMTDAIKTSIYALQLCTDEVSLARQQGRISILKELFSLSKKMFHDAEKLDKSFTG